MRAAHVRLDPHSGQLNGHTHMGMLGSTALVEFDFFLDWAGKNIDNPLLAKGCAVRTKKK